MILARGTVGFSGADLQNLVKWVLALVLGWILILTCSMYTARLRSRPRVRVRSLSICSTLSGHG